LKLYRSVVWASKLIGAFWLLDGLLQLQPYMFSRVFWVSAIESSISELPKPMYSYLLTLLTEYIIPYSLYYNLIFSLLEFLIGTLLLIPRRAALIVGNLLSITWGMLVWIIGEGMGGITSLTIVRLNLRYPDTIMTGFPGPAIIYVLISAFLLLSLKRKSYMEEASRLGAIVIFAIGGFMQLLPEFWDPRVQFSIFTESVISGSAPSTFAPIIVKFASYFALNPVLANLIEILASVSVATSLVLRAQARITIPVAAVWLGFVWVFCMGMGGLLNGTATDVGSPPVLFLLVIMYYLSSENFLKQEKHRTDLVGQSKTEDLYEEPDLLGANYFKL
jgi:hypothetical protein